MLKHIENVLKYTSSYNELAEFESDSMCVEATVFNLMQIGELAKSSLSDKLKNEVKSIPWNQIYGLRNRIVHGYDGVNLTIVWDVVKSDLIQSRDELEGLFISQRSLSVGIISLCYC